MAHFPYASPLISERSISYFFLFFYYSNKPINSCITLIYLLQLDVGRDVKDDY